MRFCAKNVYSKYLFSKMNTFMINKIVVLVFRSTLDINEKKIYIDFLKKCEYYSSLEINT